MVEGGFPILIMDIQKALRVDMYCHFQSPSLVRFASQQKRTKENEPQKLGQVNHLHPNFNPCCTKKTMLKIPQRVSTKGPVPSPKEFHQNRRLTNLKTGAIHKATLLQSWRYRWSRRTAFWMVDSCLLWGIQGKEFFFSETKRVERQVGYVVTYCGTRLCITVYIRSTPHPLTVDKWFLMWDPH